jgi:peptidoglycan-associated lipoprotein
MFRYLFVFLASLLLVVGCSKKVNPDGADNLNGDGSADISEKPLAFDPMGSDSGGIAGLNSVHFDYDSTTLTADTKAKLGQNAEWFKNNPAVNVQIEGHCDSRGSNEYNLTLGERRANAVKAYLQGLGVDAARMTIISYGEEKLLAMGDTEADHSKNRRANFVPNK